MTVPPRAGWRHNMWTLIVLMLVGPTQDIPLRIVYETPSQMVCEIIRRQILEVTPDEGAKLLGVGSCVRKEPI